MLLIAHCCSLQNAGVLCGDAGRDVDAHPLLSLPRATLQRAAGHRQEDEGLLFKQDSIDARTDRPAESQPKELQEER